MVNNVVSAGAQQGVTQVENIFYSQQKNIWVEKQSDSRVAPVSVCQVEGQY